jgi:thymidylate kinase
MTCEYNPPVVFDFTTEKAKEANKQVVYLCGPHGVGKSTLIEDLKQFDMGRVKEQIAHMEGLTDNVSRQVWRNALHCVEHRENLAYAMTQSPKSVVIGDRCFLDDMAYVNTCVEMGWLAPEYRKGIFDNAEYQYTMSLTPKPERFIVLLPPMDWNIERIEERWREGIPAKWCEKNFNYLGVVRQSFEELATNPQLSDQITVVRETTRKGRVDRIKKWLNDHDLEDFIVEGRTYIEGVRSWTGS